jgi:hypothetical protein
MTRSSRRHTSRTRRTAVTAGTACIAAVAALGLVGCSGDRLGAALVIEDRVVTTDELQSAARDYLEIVPGADAGDAQLSILQRRIVSEIIEEVAQDVGVRVGAGAVARERDDVLDSVGSRRRLVTALAQAQTPTVLAPEDIDSWVRDRLLFNKIAADICSCDLDQVDPSVSQQALTRANDLLREKSATMDIEVSPRYGAWDPDQGITPLVSGGLSQTVDELRDGGA